MTPRPSRLLTLRSHRRSFLPALLLGVGLPLAVVAFLAQHFAFGGGLGFERGLSETLRGVRTPTGDGVARALDRLGDGWLVLPLAAVIAGVLFRVRRPLGWFVLATVGGAALLHTALRAVVDRPRPVLEGALLSETGAGFPSGHVVFSAALVLALAAVLWPTRARWVVLVLGTLWVVAMGWARVYAGVHHAADVVAALLLSLGWGLAMIAVFRPEHVLER
ncbi:phosphatase PAP2 family protein [Deinococcus sp. YIM 134068]|uniref:phosphatase PAP2 family protein n=1 Tax=Deinococcus lichenicola TaxID=3118910 RepID=UPI002F957DAF